MPVSSNPLYASQWHFRLIGDIETVWAEYSGTGVDVAVYDAGTERWHPDLDGNYDTSLSYDGVGNDNGGQPYPGSYHGTAVAGILAAENNAIGGVGVAWDANLVGVNYLSALQSRLFVPYLAFNEVREYDVVNASFGYAPNFRPDIFDTGYHRSEYNTVTSSLAAGREGLGTLMVKSAGNGNNNAVAESNGVFGNAQGEGFNSIHSVITVAATNEAGYVTSYSNWGANLLITAPAASVTTDVSGSAGSSGGDYMTNFGGTSAAAPIVSGVIALMLEANPGLGWRDVHKILALSAAQTGSAYGAPATGFEENAWFANGATNWNGGGMTFNLSYGFGMVDAFAAVRMAEVWNKVNGAAQTSQNDVLTSASYDGASFLINDVGTTDLTITETDDISIEHLYVTVRYRHDDVSDVDLELISPDGTVFRLFDQDAPDATRFSGDYTFGVRGLMGTSSQGDWTVRVIDTGSGTAGRLIDVDLDFRGSAPTADTVHHLTQDYFTSLARIETSRQTLTDRDGGTDWLNLVALQGDVDLVLSNNATLSLSGQTMTATLSNGSAFENVALGDGHDHVNGNASANHLIGGRGNDVLGGLRGRDTLEGGDGNDILTGDGVGLTNLANAQAVFRLYQATLDRAPDSGGLLNWVTALETRSLTEIVSGFTDSVEFRSRYTVNADEDFVTLLYNNVLNRAPDSAGLASWVDQLKTGSLTRSEVVLGFSESREFRNTTAQSSVAATIGDARQAWTDDVFRLYQATLDRAPDLAGQLYWMANLARGMSYQDVIGGFINSVEFSNTYGDTNNTQFVTLLYNNVLNRAPDSAGLADWVGRLDSTTLSRGGVVEGFAQSVEFIKNSSEDLITFMRDQRIDDTLSGGAGVNTLYGGAGRDSFVFEDALGTHIIKDFETWDVLDFSGRGYARSDISIHDESTGTRIADATNGATLAILEGWYHGDITEDHFIF